MRVKTITIKKDSRGFTLLELMVVMALMLGTTMVALPKLSRTNQVYQLSAASSTIRARLSFARIQAISRNMDYRVRVVTSTSYVIERRPSGSWETVETFTMPSGFSVSANGSAEFRPRGTASSSATFTVTNPTAETRSVAVAASGYINAL